MSNHGTSMKFRFGGLLVEVVARAQFQELEICHDFLVNTAEQAVLTVYLEPVQRVDKPSGLVVLDDLNKYIVNDDSDRHAVTIFKCSRRDPQNEPLFCAHIDSAHRTAVITYVQDNRNVEQEVFHFLGRILLRNLMVLHRGGIIHASAIACQQGALLFTAPSGTGKSTQADLWVASRGAVIINDDCPFFRFVDERAYLYGAPWSGSRNIYAKLEVPAKAIIILEQHSENIISRLSHDQAVPQLLPRCYLPYYDRRLMDMACATLEELVQRVPVFRFGCRPEREAVEVVSRCIEALS